MLTDLNSSSMHGDRARLMQMMDKLLSNAAKFSPSGEAVTVAASRREDCVRIGVRGKGSGIPPGFLPRLFEKFSQADASNTRRVGGTGLGLSIAKSIVEQHQGRIGVSTEFGPGSTFYFEIPLFAGAH